MPTWETAADWDSETSSDFIEHSDSVDATSVRLGRDDTEDNPTVFVRFDGFGDTVTYVSGNGNDGTIIGSTRVAPVGSRFQGGVSHDGIDDRVAFTDVVSTTANKHTWEVWCDPDRDGAGNSCLGTGDIANSSDAGFSLKGDDGLIGIDHPNEGGVITSISNSGPVHFMWHWNESTNEYEYFLNGTSQNSGTKSGWSISSGETDLTLAKRAGFGGEWDGTHFEFRYTTGALLSPAQSLFGTSGSLTTATKSL